MRMHGMIAVIAAAALAASASLARSDTTVGSIKASPGERSSASQWSTERMSKATEAAMPALAGKPPAASAKQRSGKPSGKSDRRPRPTKPQAPTGDIYPFPLNLAGKLFYKTPDGDYQCSAQFISPHVILTAAQCVRDPDTGTFYDNFVFALEYKDGKYLKQYDYVCAATNGGWVQSGDGRYASDYATILVDGESPNGNFGANWDWAGAYKEATMVAYVGGEQLSTLKGPVKIFDDGTVALSHGSKSDLSGAAGGAFVGKFSQGQDPNTNYVISVDSFSYNDEPGVDYGPYLDDAFKSLWDYTENNCEEPKK